MAKHRTSGYKYRLSSTDMDEIVVKIGQGVDISAICDEYSISRFFFHDWARRDTLFGQRVEQARKVAADIAVEQLKTLGDDKLKSDNIKWVASKIDREKYGEKMEVNVNQTLDISGILAAANARLGPMLDQRDLEKLQANETIAEFDELTTGHKPVAASDAPGDIDELL